MSCQSCNEVTREDNILPEINIVVRTLWSLSSVLASSLLARCSDKHCLPGQCSDGTPEFHILLLVVHVDNLVQL